MEELHQKVITDADAQQFQQQLAQYDDHQLHTFYDYFHEDLIYIMKSLDPLSIQKLLSFQNIVPVEQYLSIKKQCGTCRFAEKLFEDIRGAGKDTMLGFWKSLFVLQNDHPHPNLVGMLNELTNTGDILEQQTNLDKNGYNLPQDLTACQIQLRKNLLEKTENLEEHRAPGLTTEHESFHITERYLDVIVVSGQHFRTHSRHELIATGGIHEHYLQRVQSNLERISPNRLFRWCHRKRCVPQTVLVSGVPGVGKTTLMQKFVYDWANGKLYQRFAFVFFFKFRDLNNKDELSLAQMIIDEYPYLHNQLDKIFQEPKKLLFILDGLDESKNQMDFKSSQSYTNPHSIETLNVVVSSLVRQSVLPGCSVLITSRPTRLAMIETSGFQRLSEIMGFFPKERETYFLHFFRDYTMAEKAFRYVRENGMLYTFCYIPSFCWIICTVLSMCFRAQEAKSTWTPKTVTQLFVSFVSNILANHCQEWSVDKELLISIGKMAEHGVNNHILSFTKDDLETFSVDTFPHVTTSFLMESGQPPHVSYSFLHLTIQEFMAALVHYLDYSPVRLQKALEEAKSYKDGRGEIFLQFISGLSDSSTRSLLKPYVGDLSSSASKHVIRFLQLSMNQDIALQIPDIDIREVLNVFACLAESRNKALVSSSIGSTRQLNFSEFHLSPLDCTVLAFILQSCKETELLDLTKSYIHSEGLERVASVLHTVTNLSLTENNLRDEDMPCISSILTHPQCRIQRLRLQEIKLTPEYAKSLLSLTNNTNLTHLNISSNFFGDTGYPHIQKLILEHRSLKEIKVKMNDFSEETEKNLQQLQTHRPDVAIKF
ncbi:NACHT, LRR and PYD domains-containing protein 3 isoform X2 [Xenopus laevis]|uniref:NACHT, LRR and PYD domains-containing protein 3 isoform X2 n=1 Tax=Xenopus laevis TaxID=8355 RepID=A0A8J1LKH4_XENLA|nr:NACHT, LRR and PYD domains-containing protein 3 isoform X2 [Xenopus laevis]